MEMENRHSPSSTVTFEVDNVSLVHGHNGRTLYCTDPLERENTVAVNLRDDRSSDPYVRIIMPWTPHCVRTERRVFSA